MRILIGFGVCCVAMAGALVWLVRPALVTLEQPDSPALLTADNKPPENHVAAVDSIESASPASEVLADTAVDQGTRRLSSNTPVEAASFATHAASAPVTTRRLGVVRAAGSRQSLECSRRLTLALDAIARDPQNVIAIDDALAAAKELGDEPRIADLLGRKLRMTPDDQSLRFSYAAALMRQRQWVLALPELREVALAWPNDVRVWFNLALTQHALGSLSDAREAWGRVLELAPHVLDARARRAEASLDFGDWQAAVIDLEFVIAADPQAADAALNLALARMKLRQFDAARTAIRALLSSEALEPTARRRLEEIDAAERQVGAAP